MVDPPDDTPQHGEAAHLTPPPGQGEPSRGPGVRIGRISARHHQATAPVPAPAGQARTWLSRRLDRLVAVGHHRLGRRASRYGHRYRERVLASLRLVDAEGPGASVHLVPDLIVPDGPAGGPRRRSIRDLIGGARPVVLAVVGAPGSGKTTLLRHLTRRIAREPHRQRRPLPVLLDLREHARRLVADPATTLPVLLRSAVPDLTAGEPPGFWDEELWRGRCVVLLDGLDEVADPEDRRAVSGWLERQFAGYPENDYVVTARPAWDDAPAVGAARVLRVGTLTDEQLTAFLHEWCLWYLAAERRATGSGGGDDGDDGGDVGIRAGRAAADLRQRLAAVPAVYALAGNPLLLTMIATVHRYRGTLPGTRADLYAEACRVVLRRGAGAAHLSARVPAADSERLLARLAFAMMRQRVGDLPRGEVLRAVGPALGRISAAVSADGFLDGIGATGLLVERGNSRHAFAHHTFQEYLAARHVGENDLGHVLAGTVDDAWWRETTLFYAADHGATGADAIVRACLESGTTPALSLAFDCAEGATGLAPGLRAELDRIVAEAFDAGCGAGRRRLVAGVLAARYLRGAVTTPTGTSLCPRPVTTDLYTLFLRDTGTPPPDGRYSPDPDAAATVTGMWADDATAFLTWINAVASPWTGVWYRLPTAAELHALAAGSGADPGLAARATCAWSAPEPAGAPTAGGTPEPAGGTPEPAGGTPEPWVPAGAPVPDTVTGTDLLAALTADVTGSGLAARVLRFAIGALLAAAGRVPERLDGTRLRIAPTDRLQQHLTSARDLAFALGRTLAPAEGGGLAEARTSAIELAGRLGDALEYAAGYAASVDRAAAHVRELRRDVAHGFDLAVADAHAGGFVPPAGDPVPGPGFDLAAALGPADGRGGGRRAAGPARALAAACANGQCRARLVVEAIDRVRAAASTVNHEIDVARVDADVIHVDLLQARGRPLAGMRQRATVQARELARLLDAAYRHAARAGDEHAAELARARAACLELERALQPARVLAPVLGTALLEALLAVLHQPDGDEAGWSRPFVNRLLRAGGIALTDEYPIRLDALAGTAARACSGITALAPPDASGDAGTGTGTGTGAGTGGGSATVTAWAGRTAGRLHAAATAVFTRRRPVTPRLASEIRGTAVALAAEAEVVGRPDIADAFRTVAAGVTLLGRRAAQEAPFPALLLAQA